MLLIQSSIRGMGNVSVFVTDFTYGSPYTCEKFHQTLAREYKENSIHLARFYKVIVQQILYFFPEILLFYMIHSVWMLFHRF